MSLEKLTMAQQRFKSNYGCLEALEESQVGQEMLIPLNSSLLIGGKLVSNERVSIDMGTGYQAETNLEDAKSYYARKQAFLGEQMEMVRKRLAENHAHQSVLVQAFKSEGSAQ